MTSASQTVAGQPQVQQVAKPRSQVFSHAITQSLIYLTLIILGHYVDLSPLLDGHLGAQG